MTRLPPVAILAGGLATRMRPLTEQIPKALLEVAGKPFIVHQIDLLREHGITQIVMCIGFLGEMIQAEIGDGAALGVEIQYSPDGDKLLGTGGALKQALPLLGESFYVTYGDAYLETDYAAVAARFWEQERDGLMVVYRNENRWDASNVVYADGQIVRYDKVNRTPAMQYIDWGVGMLKASVFDAYPDGEKFDLATVYMDLVAHGQMSGYEAKQRFYEIGSKDGLAETDAYLRARGVGGS
jgi:NDP-sugar pyrophosphorylase family protein